MHQQNGCAEGFICTVMDKAQAMCLDACLPQNWWEFAVDCATHFYNYTPIQCHDWKMHFEKLKCMKPDVTHLCISGCGAYVFLPEEVQVNKLNPKSELMIFLGYLQGTKGYLFMRRPNNVLFTVVQALFNETLFPECPDMCHPRYTPVVPSVDTQGEYNIPPVDSENGDHGGVDMHPALHGRCVPHQAPPPGNNQNPDAPTPPGSTPPDSDSENGFYGTQVSPATPPPRSPQGDPDSSHRYFNPNPDPSDRLYD